MSRYFGAISAMVLLLLAKFFPGNIAIDLFGGFLLGLFLVLLTVRGNVGEVTKLSRRGAKPFPSFRKILAVTAIGIGLLALLLSVWTWLDFATLARRPIVVGMALSFAGYLWGMASACALRSLTAARETGLTENLATLSSVSKTGDLGA